MSAELLEDFVRAERERALGVYGICVHREGRPPVEHRFRSDDRVNLYSVAKTFTSVAVGLAEAEGRLSLDDRLLDHLPELRPIAADGFADVTLRQLLTMTSGTSHRWFADERTTAADLLHEIVAAPLVAAPGARFAYTGSGPYALGRVIARVTGADLRSYLLPRLFAPLDLHNPAWHTCPLGHPFAESDLFLRTEELARFARLLVQEGRWEGRQVLPAEYVRRMTGDRVDTSTITYGEQYTHGYGLGVWIDRADTYRLDGRYGQYVVVSPARRAAVTVTAHAERDGELLTAIHKLVVARC
ncbi:serine hydrolase domain-containing protein [Micromonospora peucetia]|uniref:CubicO group peptidase, beta-lactamase class C family n=1 Tax=Micromonospora peucetia TaxID=47871 RepID=A0A1C6VWE3_9ACTN|nr:serine hydrolase [Micromonospora peucetia]SCL70681.1 CubicO group peptidase, beta-lactamase class C family [Micromonospora peucetia]